MMYGIQRKDCVHGSIRQRQMPSEGINAEIYVPIAPDRFVRRIQTDQRVFLRSLVGNPRAASNVEYNTPSCKGRLDVASLLGIT